MPCHCWPDLTLHWPCTGPALSASAAAEQQQQQQHLISNHPQAPITMTSAPNTPAGLDAPFLYQNRRTGSASSAPLTIRQLCRLICPPSSTAAAAAAGGGGAGALVVPETPVIGYDPLTGQYSSDGWVQARTVPILREAGASWYFEVDAAAATSTSSADSGDVSGTDRIRGPISARELSRLLHSDPEEEEEEESNIKMDFAVDGLTRVWSSDIVVAEGADDESGTEQQQQWKGISELPFLRMALEAFEDTHLQWATNQIQGQGRPSDVNGKDGALGDTTGQDKQPQQQMFDPSAMTYDAEKHGAEPAVGENGDDADDGLSKQEADDLESFLNSTAADIRSGANSANGHSASNRSDDEEEEYESDGGTRYVRDPLTGNWIHEALAPKRETKEKKSKHQQRRQTSSSAMTVDSSDKTVRHSNKAIGDSGSVVSKTSTNAAGGSAGGNKKRKKRGKFSAKNSKCWVYVTGIPFDATEDEIAKYFGRVGVLDLDPSTQHPKVKLYRRREGDPSGPEGSLKGDASVCYARAESVDLALQFLDDSYLRVDSKEKLKVERAKFEQHGDKFEDRGKISNAKRKVAKLAALQAVGWDEGENGRITGGRKGLCIIVLKGMFDLFELQNEGEDKILESLEREVRKECKEWGNVEKITVFSKNPEGVVVVKFSQPTAASSAVTNYHGKMRRNRKIDASFWDGVTDFTVREEEKEREAENKRLDEFGSWLDNQEVPEEFQLQVQK